MAPSRRGVAGTRRAPAAAGARSDRRRSGDRCAAPPTRWPCGCAITTPRSMPGALPSGETARAIFEGVEQARVEALGARRMAGVAANLAAMLEERYRRQGYEHLAERNDTTLAEAVRLLAREALTGARAAAGGAARRRDVAALPRGQGRPRPARAQPPRRQPGSLRQDRAPAASTISTSISARPSRRPRARTADGEGEDSRPEREPERGRRGRRRRRARRARRRRARAAARGRPDAAGAEELEGELMPGAGDEDPGRPGRPGDLAAPRPQRRSQRLSRLHHRVRRDRWRPTQLCDRRRADAAARACSTSSSRICKASSPGSPTGCSAG